MSSLLSAGTGLYELDEAQLLKARPDLIIAQDLCDVCAITSSQLDHVVRSLSPAPRMVTLSPRRLEDILRDIETLGAAIGLQEAGKQFSAELRARMNAIRAKVTSEHIRPKVACLEWLAPLYAAGHWVPDMVAAAGGLDVLASAGTASRKVNWDMLFAASPDVIVLMPCGFTVERTRIELAALTEQSQWKHLPAVQTGAVFLVDALAYFSRPGPRLIDGLEQLAAILHPAQFDHSLPPAVERLAQHSALPQ